MGRFDDGKGINDNERKEFGRLVSNQKGGLSESEINQFKKLVSEDNSRRFNKEGTGTGNEQDGANDVQIRSFIHTTRSSLIRSLNFNSEETSALASLQSGTPSKNAIRDYIHFACLTIDHVYFVREKLHAEDAVIGKLLFTLGIHSLKQLDEECRKTVLFRLVNLLVDYGYYAYSTHSVQVLSDLNELIADLGSVLSIAVSSKEAMYNASSLHLNILFDINFKNKKFSYFVSDKDAETVEFKRLYDFYFKNEGKTAFEKAVLKQEKREKAETFFTKDLTTDSGVSLEVKRLIAKYSNTLDVKLASLRKRGDML